MTTLTLEQVSSFADKFTIADNGCWEWNKYVGTHGYGQHYVNNLTILAHRLAYNLVYGEIPKGMQLDHLCRNRVCCNPNHLEPVTHKENARRGLNGKYLSARTHCPSEHEYTKENTKIVNRGQSRACRECHRIANINYRKKIKEAR